MQFTQPTRFTNNAPYGYNNLTTQRSIPECHVKICTKVNVHNVLKKGWRSSLSPTVTLSAKKKQPRLEDIAPPKAASSGFDEYKICPPIALPTPPFQFNGYPEIIGEGNVTSIISSDGSTQYLFMPTTQWWRPRPQYPNSGNFYNPCVNNLGAWFVRSFYTPMQPTFFGQPYQIPCGSPYSKASTSDCCLNLPAADVPLKFHNHNSTSTSDIHYFIPKPYNWFETPKMCTAVQVDIPLAINRVVPPCEVIQVKPNVCTPAPPPTCNCSKNDRRKQNDICVRYQEVNTSNSEMSVDECKSDSDKKCCKLRKRKTTKEKASQPKVQCKCITHTVDKSVTTYSDQGTYMQERCPKSKTVCTSLINITSNPDMCESGCCICGKAIEPCN